MHHLNKFYATKLENSLISGINSENPLIIDFLRENIYPLYKTACEGANISENPEIIGPYSTKYSKLEITSQNEIMMIPDGPWNNEDDEIHVDGPGGPYPNPRKIPLDMDSEKGDFGPHRKHPFRKDQKSHPNKRY